MISITQFLFSLETILLENSMIDHNIRELDWECVDYFANYLLKDYPDFHIKDTQYQRFKRNYQQYKRQHQNRKQPVETLAPQGTTLRCYSHQRCGPEPECGDICRERSCPTRRGCTWRVDRTVEV